MVGFYSHPASVSLYVDDVSFWRGILSERDVVALHGGANGLGLNASDLASILTGFDDQVSV